MATSEPRTPQPPAAQIPAHRPGASAPLRLPVPALVVLLLLATAVLLGLGTWQVQRNEWKQGLVADRNARIEAPPLTPAEANALPLDEVDYHRVIAEGEWDHARTMTIANRARFGMLGEEAVTPLLLGPDGPALLVIRGWYPATERDEVRADLDAEGAGAIEGLARSGDTSGGREIRPATWSRLDVEAMSEGFPYAVLPWFVVQGELVPADAPHLAGGALPVREYRPFVNTTPHVGYAVTWYGIAFALWASVAGRVYVARRRRGEARERPSEEEAEPAPVERRAG